MLSQTPKYSPLTISDDEVIILNIEFEGEKPSEARAVVDDEVIRRTDLDPEASEWEFKFSRDDPGEYHVELIVDGMFPDRLGHLYEQDALEFNDTEAHAEWDIIVVESEEQQSTPARIWSIVTNLATISFLVRALNWVSSIAQNKGGEGESETSSEVNARLDEFIDEGEEQDSDIENTE